MMGQVQMGLILILQQMCVSMNVIWPVVMIVSLLNLAGTVTAYEGTVAEGIDITGKSRSDAEKLLLEKTKGLSVI